MKNPHYPRLSTQHQIRERLYQGDASVRTMLLTVKVTEKTLRNALEQMRDVYIDRWEVETPEARLGSAIFSIVTAPPDTPKPAKWGKSKPKKTDPKGEQP